MVGSPAPLPSKLKLRWSKKTPEGEVRERGRQNVQKYNLILQRTHYILSKN
jgi:hypothetical protein